MKKDKLPPLMMIPVDGEYHILPLPKKKSWFEDLLETLLIGGFVVGVISFCSYVVMVVNGR